MNISGLLTSLGNVIRTVSLADIIDIAIVAFIFYKVLSMLRETKAMQMIRIVVFVFFGYILATQQQLRTVTFLIESLMQVAFIAALVIFRPELRKMIEKVSKDNLMNMSFLRRRTAEQQEIERLQKSIVAICDGMERMSEKQTGALIVMENFSNIEGIKATGTPVNADITPELIGTIFYDGSPLHDGAVVVHDGRISCAGCVLPLSDNLEISKEMGTRHRAALGISEETDAIALVVSEETGTISYAKNGVLHRHKDRRSLYAMLTREFIAPLTDAAEETITKGLFRRREKKDERE